GQQQLNGGKAAITEGQQALAAQKELVGNALSQLRILVIQREGLLKLGLTEEAKKVQATIDGIRSGMKAGEAELAKVGVDLSTIDKDLASINLAISNFNISMAVASDTLGNQMAELTGTGAYLQSLTLQLEASMAEMKESAKSAGAKVNMDGMLTVENLSSLLKAQNMDLPAGYIAQGEQELLVSVGDKFKGIEELREMVLVNPGIEGIAPIKLSDVATVSYMSNGEDTYAKINGEDGVLLTFSKQSDVSTAQVAENIQAKFIQLEEKYTGLQFTTLSDQGKYIELVIDSVLQNLILGGVLAILILLFFLRDIKPTLITAVSIPISVTFAIALMYFTGVSVNVVSLAGLAVGVGMLVDNSIVVIENIYRLRTLGYSKIKAAAMGAGQVSSAITSSTITTICVFFPIVFVDGLTKQVFLDMALTVTYSLLASLLIALTVVPAMSRGMLTKIKEKTVFGKDSRAITLYQKSVAFALEHKAWVLGITLMLFLASIGLGVARGFSYMPGMVGQEISASVTLPADTPKEECMRRSDELAEKIKDIQGVETVGVLLNSDVGAVMGMSAGKKDFTKVEFYILIGEEEIGRNGEISKEISKIGKDYAEKITVSGDTDMTAAMGGNGVG
ncbi:MAG: efflux RND transporter permease subunit, partial [Anaerovoracaceae bacterium]